MLAAMLVAVALAGQAPGMPEGTKVEYDRAGDLTAIRVRLGEVEYPGVGTHVITLAAFHRGKRPRRMDEVELTLNRMGRDLYYGDDHRVVIARGDRRLKVRSVDFRAMRDDDGPAPMYSECFIVRIGAADLQAFVGTGEDVKVDLGPDYRLEIGPETRLMMLRFARAARSGRY